MSIPAGHFAWIELATLDVPAAIAWYTRVIGWKVQEIVLPSGPYTQLLSEQGPLGGVTELPPMARQMGSPPYWQGYVSVDDLDATVAQAVAEGATVFVPPIDVQGVGRLAVVADPQGAFLAYFHNTDPDFRLHRGMLPGEVAWRELLTTDAARALDWYDRRFGWRQQQAIEMGPGMTYRPFGLEDEVFGGAYDRPAHLPMSFWLYYFAVQDLDQAVARAVELGGRLLLAPTPVPGGARIAQLLDPQGAALGLLGQ